MKISRRKFISGAVGAAHILHNHTRLEKKVYLMPEEINAKIAEIKLDSIGVQIDSLTAAQKEYLGL